MATFSELNDLAKKPTVAAPARYSQNTERTNQLCSELLAFCFALGRAGAVLARGLVGLRVAMPSKITATPVITGQAGR